VSDLLQAAGAYLARGWLPVPIPAGSKGPNLPNWQRLRLSADDLPLHFSHGGNVGLILGEPSGGLVDVDLDCDEAVALAGEYLPATGAISGRGGRPASHRWYIAEGAATKKYSDPQAGMVVEIRSTGCQTVVGPSLHPTGDPYLMLEGEPAIVPAGLLRACCDALFAAVIRQRHGDAVADALGRPSTSLALAPCVPSGQDESEVMRRAERYLATVDAAIDGQGGSMPTFRAACALVNGFALSPDVAYDLLARVYNPRCAPPWSEKELRHKVEDAAKAAHDKPRGHLRDAEGPVAPELFNLSPTRRIDAAHGASNRPMLLKLGDVERTAVKWIWPGRIPRGKLTLVAGEPGQGKSTMTCDIVARITTGNAWPDTPNLDLPGDVVLLSAEDDLADTIAPRLDAAGADSERVFALQGIEFATGGKRCFNLEADLGALNETVLSLPDCRLVVIDPVSAYCGKLDSHNNTEVRGMLMPLSDLAAERNVAILMVTHLSKGEASKALHRFMGSIAFAAAARACWLVEVDKDDSGRRLFLPVKQNLAKNVGGLAFRIVDRMVAGQSIGAVEWEPGRIDTLAEAALSGDAGRGPSAVDDCAEWLSEYMADGPKLASEAEEAAKANSFSVAAVRRAKKRLGIVSRCDGFQGQWRWVFPGQTLWPDTGVATEALVAP